MGLWLAPGGVSPNDSSSLHPPDRADLWDGRHQDLRVGDPADALSARMLLGEYARVMSTLTAEDVLASHEASLGG